MPSDVCIGLLVKHVNEVNFFIDVPLHAGLIELIHHFELLLMKVKCEVEQEEHVTSSLNERVHRYSKWTSESSQMFSLLAQRTATSYRQSRSKTET